MIDGQRADAAALPCPAGTADVSADDDRYRR